MTRAIAALLALTACGGSDEPRLNPRLDLALAVPRSAHVVEVPGAIVRAADAPSLAAITRSCEAHAPYRTRGELTCAALRLDGDRLVVPFVGPRPKTPIEVIIGPEHVLIATNARRDDLACAIGGGAWGTRYRCPCWMAWIVRLVP